MKSALRRGAAALVALWLLVPAPAVRAQDTTPPAKEAAVVPPKPPREVDGVLLEDGRQIEGTFEEKAGQRWIITPKGGGEPLNVSVTEIVVAEKGGELEQRGDDSAAAAVWRAALRAPYCEALEKVLEQCKAGSLHERATAVVKLLKAAGTPEPRIKRLEVNLPKKDAPLDAALDAPAKAAEDAARAAYAESLLPAVDWCAKRRFPTAATSLLAEIARVDPSKAEACEKRAAEFMGEGFFFKDKPDAVKQWMVWADALLPSNAVFVSEDDEDDAWERLENKPWTDGQTLCMRTRNVLMFIREMNPAYVGKALRLAEATCRALDIFLHEGEPYQVAGDAGRLEVRIHKTRKDYLDEVPKRGSKADEWSAGYYSPSGFVSHFYFDRAKDDGPPNMEALRRVLTHELTHQYMHARWAEGHSGRGDGDGFWVVEGMAEFIEGQSRRLEDRGLKFDDDRAPGNVITAKVRGQGIRSKWLAMPTFVDMDQQDFGSMDDDERGLWYAQAGALTYFLLQKKGPEIRRKFVRYVLRHYMGIQRKQGWTEFGYDSAEVLDREFMQFLGSVGAK